MLNYRQLRTPTTTYSSPTLPHNSRSAASGSCGLTHDYGKINNRLPDAHAADGMWEQSANSIKQSDTFRTSGGGAGELLPWRGSCEEFESESPGDRDRSPGYRGPYARDANGISGDRCKSLERHRRQRSHRFHYRGQRRRDESHRH